MLNDDVGSSLHDDGARVFAAESHRLIESDGREKNPSVRLDTQRLGGLQAQCRGNLRRWRCDEILSSERSVVTSRRSGVSLRIVADFGDRELTIIDGLTAWTAVGPDSTG